MESLPDSSDDQQLELLAASLRADRADLGTFMAVLAAKLEELLPEAVRVERKRSGFRGPLTVRTITVNGGGQRLGLSAAERGSGPPTASRARVSGGIVLKTEQIPVDEWLVALTGILAAELAASETARQTLARVLLDDGPGLPG